ncbi:MAG: LysE family translocator [Acidobacteria bacterium]|nr:LysE family translocator [Acidobacteriota bacterium]
MEEKRGRMPDLPTLSVFVAGAAILLITPGPAVLYIVTRSVDQGRRAGVVSALGISGGTLIHVAAAVLGLSAILASSAVAFSAVKYLGAVYLIYLGVQKFRGRDGLEQPHTLAPQSLTRIFGQGVVVNVLNPKNALFFLAFLPQFVDPARGNAAGQILFLGLLFAVMGVLSDGSYALLAGSAAGWLRGSLRFLRLQRYFAGSVYIGLGLATAFSGSGKNK